MNSQYALGLSKQGISVYKLLINESPLSVLDISKRLKITRQNIYRITNHLVEIGLIEALRIYPAKYKVKPVNEGRSTFLAQQGNWFSSMFLNTSLYDSHSLGKDNNKPFEITFFQSRDEHMDQQAIDINAAKTGIKYIAVTLPVGVNTELMLSYTRAAERGLELKLITQEYSQDNKAVINAYKRIGTQVRKGKYIGWHLILIDDYISYILMFDPGNKVIQTGVRMAHKGINRELSTVFENCWAEATDI